MNPDMNIAQFYDADPRRRESEEVIYGDRWTDDADRNAVYRLAFVEDTGELYAVREPHPGGLLNVYLDELDLATPDVDELRVTILGRFASRAEVEAALQGWPDAMQGDDSLAWVRDRVGTREPS